MYACICVCVCNQHVYICTEPADGSGDKASGALDDDVSLTPTRLNPPPPVIR